VILKEGTEDTYGKGQIISNINACAAVVDVIKTTLGKYASINSKRIQERQRHLLTHLCNLVVFKTQERVCLRCISILERRVNALCLNFGAMMFKW
jgi:hypothetical protein